MRRALPRPYYTGPVSDHFDGTRFFNPDGGAPRSLVEVLRWRIGGRREPWPRSLPSPCPPDRPPPRVANGLRVVLVGHATFLIQAEGLNILTDPVWSERASPLPFFGPRRRSPPGIAFDDLPTIDLVLLSHNHYDHLDLPTLSRLWRRDRPRMLAPLGNDAIIHRHDPDILVEARDWDDSVALAPNATASLVPATHWSARGTHDRNHALWSGYVLRLGPHSLYFAGDTGFGEGRLFRSIAERATRLDVALLPIGAYEPRWFMSPQHMNPEEAVRAFQLLGARQALGCHWGTFRLTDEGPLRPAADLSIALADQGIDATRFLALRPGEAWVAP